MIDLRFAGLAALLALAACSSSEGDGADGAGGSPDASCTVPSSFMPRIIVTGATTTTEEVVGRQVVTAEGAVTETSAERTIVIDTCLDDTCTPALVTVAFESGFVPAIPVGTLVSLEVAPVSVDGLGGTHTEDATPSVKILNVPNLGGVANPTASDEHLWFLSSNNFGCGTADAPLPEISAVKTCETELGRGYVRTSDLVIGEQRMADGDVASFDVGEGYDVAFRGKWEGDEMTTCRWQVARHAP